MLFSPKELGQNNVELYQLSGFTCSNLFMCVQCACTKSECVNEFQLICACTPLNWKTFLLNGYAGIFSVYQKNVSSIHIHCFTRSSYSSTCIRTRSFFHIKIHP